MSACLSLSACLFFFCLSASVFPRQGKRQTDREEAKLNYLLLCLSLCLSACLSVCIFVSVSSSFFLFIHQHQWGKEEARKAEGMLSPCHSNISKPDFLTFPNSICVSTFFLLLILSSLFPLRFSLLPIPHPPRVLLLVFVFFSSRLPLSFV